MGNIDNAVQLVICINLMMSFVLASTSKVALELLLSYAVRVVSDNYPSWVGAVLF